MRVIAGIAKGRRFATPPGKQTRPLTDRTREALFSALGDSVEGSRVLDLFAGSGSLGIEALSRGAATAVFVEKSRKAAATLQTNLSKLGFEGEVFVGDVFGWLGRNKSQFDIAFIDPPFAMELALVSALMSEVGAAIGDGGTMVVHRRAGEAHPETPIGWAVRWVRRFGDGDLFLLDKVAP
jgi:16S rRNA (guanine966-N2)-methyltransferase